MAQNTKHRRNKKNKSVKKQKVRGGAQSKASKSKASKSKANIVVKTVSTEVSTEAPKVISFGRTDKCKGNRPSCSVMDDSSSSEE